MILKENKPYIGNIQQIFLKATIILYMFHEVKENT